MRAQVGQFYKEDMLRELRKAFIGFKADSQEEETKDGKKSITTGRWGCGAYNGHPELKFALQWIAASANERDMIFSTFGEQDCSKLQEIADKFKGKTISELYLQLIYLRGFLLKKDGNGDKTKGIKKKKEMFNIVANFMNEKK
mmetsp:Transcript_16601/g.14495  ORF Transcript_16601/g.14495 Transcript_16601/m.14495 type:complete len:143 (+) Transcript_16601:1144-1572(+)